MTRSLWKLALCGSLTILALPPDAFAGRGGGGAGRGGGGGGMQRGGEGGMQRGGMQGGGQGGMQRGGQQGGMQRGGEGGGYGGGASHSPSFSQPRSPSGGSASGNRSQYPNGSSTANRNPNSSNPNAAAGAANRNQANNPSAAGAAAAANRNQANNPSAAGAAAAANRNQANNPSAAGAAAAANRNQANNPSAAGAAAVANRNQANNPSAAGAAAVANRNQSQFSNAGAAAAGAGAANRNQSQFSNAGAAAAGAGYANRNQSQFPNAGAAAVGAGYANRNQPQYPNAGAAAAGAAYANRNNYDQYHPGLAYGAWNNNYGAGLGAYGGMGMAAPGYGYGSTPYMNPYAAMAGIGGVGQGNTGQPQPANNNVAANNAAPANNTGYDYNQPIDVAAAPPDAPPADDPSQTPLAQAREAFQSGDYATALQLTQQSLAQTPINVSLHEFLALVLFAQGSYEKAAAPLYAVLSVGPGWNWTTLIGNYADAGVYSSQMHELESFVQLNPRSPKAEFVMAYHYICQGHGEAAIRPLKNVVALQPNDKLSAAILEKLQPSAAAEVAVEPIDPAKLPGTWVAPAPPNASITLTIAGDSEFSWAFAAPNKPPVTIKGTYTLANNVMTLNSKDTPGGPLIGDVSLADDGHLNFKAVGSPSSDPGLKFAR